MLTVQYYYLLLWYNAAFTIIFLLLMMQQGLPVNRGSFFVSKLLGYGFAVVVHFYLSKYQYIYFRNAGMKLRGIILAAAVADIIVYLLVAITCLP